MRQYLLIDADDTLWENNIYFERAFEEFVDLLDHSTLAPQEVRAVLDEIELANSKTHGYGSKSFGRNLGECYRKLAQREVSKEDLKRVLDVAERILDQPVDVLEGVPETLEYLAARHHLTLLTKGHAEEQKLKLDRSGLGIYFSHAEIVKEKDAASYTRLLTARGLTKSVTWMIGNSPKSDVNPALACGINAVFIPHAHTWALEKQEIANGGPGRLLILDRFSSLRDHF